MIESILLIDDSEPDNFLHVYLLNRAKACNTITSVLNVEKAIEFLDTLERENKKMPSIILIDINMPRLNGWEFLDILRKPDNTIDLENTKFYMLTTSLNPDDKEKALNEYKLDGFFNKPLNQTHIDILVKAID
jgi:CheY-like chemotaxis protein